jgi:hypothetical protein
MNPLHQQLAQKVLQIAADEALVAADEHLLTTHQAKERLPRLRNELAKLRTDIEIGELAARHFEQGLNYFRTIATTGRELSLGISDAETAAWRFRNHLGQACDD